MSFVRPEALRTEQLLLLCNYWIRTPAPVTAVCAAVAYLVWQYTAPALAIGWAVVTVGGLILRMRLCRRLLRTGAVQARPHRWARTLSGVAFINGSLGGSPAYLFFPVLPAEGQALMTAILGGWGAATVGANGPYAPAYYAFAVGFYTPLVVAWAGVGNGGGPLIAALLALLAVMMSVFARELSGTAARSIAIRFQNEALIELLKKANDAAESARHHAEEASRSKSRFLAAAAHDLSQPLHALTLLIGLMDARARDPDQREVAASIGRAVESLRYLFTELLDLSRLDAGVVVPSLTVVNVRDVIEGIRDEYRSKAAAKGLAFTAEACDRAILTDYVLLERILRNLLENAIRYTDHGEVSIACQPIGNQVAVTVADTGIGIAAAEQEKIFDEFYQVHNRARDRHKGLGLGLAIVQRLIERLGHKIELQSEPGKGSRFTLRIPVSRVTIPATNEARADWTPLTAQVKGATVLVVDDESEVRGVLSLLLREWGCRPIVADSLASARAQILETGNRPDVMLVDYRLGEDENGIAVINALQAEIGYVPAILVTGDTGSEQLLEFEDAGYPVLHKPVKAEELLALMHQLLQKGCVPAD